MADTFSAAWIGIGGQFDTTLIQCGTEQDSVNGQTEYSAWYELLPSVSVNITKISVSPGDQIQASIQLSNSTPNSWTINMIDATNGQSFQITGLYFSSQLSAEWIMERPFVGVTPRRSVLASIANFGTIGFNECTASFNYVSGSISNYPSNKAVMFSSILPGNPSIQLANVSDLNLNGNAFTVDYLASG